VPWQHCFKKFKISKVDKVVCCVLKEEKENKSHSMVHLLVDEEREQFYENHNELRFAPKNGFHCLGFNDDQRRK
jgi:hypothetical protein